MFLLPSASLDVTEALSSRKYEAYPAYQSRVSAFFPWFPKYEQHFVESASLTKGSPPIMASPGPMRGGMAGSPGWTEGELKKMKVEPLRGLLVRPLRL